MRSVHKLQDVIRGFMGAEHHTREAFRAICWPPINKGDIPTRVANRRAWRDPPMKMKNPRRVRACRQRDRRPPMMKGGDRVISMPVAVGIGGVPPML
jgi:hypothetical protein